MLYTLLKLIYKAGLWVFFKKFEVRNRHLIPGKGPLLVVSNHPNTFMDPIVTASLLDQPVFFIAKSTVFGGKFQNWMLRQMHLIPINRREDSPEQAISNEEAFAASYRALEQGKTILIFPEGNSFNQRRLRKIKTGAARIALGVEAENQHTLGLRILPVGLNYSAPTRFQSEVFVNFGESIAVADYAEAFQKDAQGTVLALTEEIRNRMESLIIHTPTDEEDELARHVEVLYKEKIMTSAPVITPAHEHDFILSRAIVKSINYFSQTAPKRVERLKQRIGNYMLQLKRLQLQDAVLGKGHEDIVRQSIKGLLLMVLGFPVYLYGLVHNYLPYIIPSKVARAVTKEEEWYAPIMLTAGIFSFPLFYALEVWLVEYWFDLGLPWLIFYAFSLPLSGFFTLGYWNRAQHTQDHWLLLRLFFKRQHVVNDLRAQRTAIVTELEQARQEYLQQREEPAA
ncbi:1-acyl-sn-glycerol-3-phosphate acyltransferase [Pontibacter aydingkolensis]|uniref:Lysophospholipid acyltransferase family protein n=1 Tax=Pontibacter aydingkolensis TaxID=1911536 RepID=A0ABS7CYD3_9BACT|nr:1-acyl-sn-glycerol-3-phosphate acyltransferase [Pontibacter aydingkolensis]MBW7468830.1 lysophospholipid acyltransferase family protein [Pontibacter aydingkolensis]